MTHDELVEAGRRWLLRPWNRHRGMAGPWHSACCVVLTEITTAASETPDVLGWDGFSSILIECKTSRSDFRADAKKFFRKNPGLGMGMQRYFLAPVGILDEAEIPEGWGFIEIDDQRVTRVRRNSSFFEADRGSEIRVLLSLLRRLKIDPGLHVAIRAYTIQGKGEPRATVTLGASDAEAQEEDR